MRASISVRNSSKCKVMGQGQGCYVQGQEGPWDWSRGNLRSVIRDVIRKVPGGVLLAVQWLGLSAFTAMAQVQSLVRELRSCKSHGMAKKKKKKKILKHLVQSLKNFDFYSE